MAFSTVSLQTLISFAFLFSSTECVNILFFIGFGGQSHRIAMEPLANALTERGHQVTFLVQEVPVSRKNPKIKYFVSEKVREFFESVKDTEHDFNLYDIRKQGKVWQSWFLVPWYGVHICEALYDDTSFLELMQGPRFDLVFIDGLLNECGYGLAHLHQSKVILFVVSSVLPWIVDGIGIPDESSSIPDLQFNFPREMSFGERLVTAVMPVFWKLYREWNHFPHLERITKEGAQSLNQTNIPSFAELERNTDLVLVNTHVAQEYPRSLPPNVIAIGGISWSDERSPLPKELENFIDKGKHGFVYVNFGSFVDFAMFPAEVQQIFLNVLGSFSDYQFIWKMSAKPENLPKNIYVQKWMPQQDILFHPKIRVFITHAGLGSLNEAIYSTVPLLCFPVFAEQDYNARLVENKGMGLKMEITKLTEEELKGSFTELLSNNKLYRENMKTIRMQFLDRPMKPLETALWWTEYVLRQDTLTFRRPLNIHQSWWVKRQIDVWVFLSFILILTLTLMLFLQWKLVKFLFNSTITKAMKKHNSCAKEAKRSTRKTRVKQKFL